MNHPSTIQELLWYDHNRRGLKITITQLGECYCKSTYPFVSAQELLVEDFSQLHRAFRFGDWVLLPAGSRITNRILTSSIICNGLSSFELGGLRVSCVAFIVVFIQLLRVFIFYLVQFFYISIFNSIVSSFLYSLVFFYIQQYFYLLS